MLSLFPHQVETEHQLRACLQRGVRRAVVALPTGSGKTIVAADLMAKALVNGHASLFLAPRRQVVDQTWEKLTGVCGLPAEQVSVVMGRSPRWVPGAPLSVACVDSLSGRDLPRPPRLVIVDECHLDIAAYLPILQRWQDAHVVGLSATPGAGLAEYFQDIVAPVGVRELTEGGFLAPVTCYSVPVNDSPDLTEVPVDADGDFQARPLAKATDRPTITGSIVDHWLRLAGGRPTLAFGVSIAHAESIAQAFADRGIPSASLHSKMPGAERAAALARFKAGEVTVLSSCDCLSEGFDAPWAKCAVLVRPTESIEKYLQQVGRVLRVHQGERAVVIDVVGNVRKHLLPDHPTAWTLQGARPRMDAVSLSQCPKCWATFRPAPVCPMCGYEKPTKPGSALRVVDGELVEVTEDPTVRREPSREQYRAKLYRQAHAAGIQYVERFVEARMAKKFPEGARG